MYRLGWTEPRRTTVAVTAKHTWRTSKSWPSSSHFTGFSCCTEPVSHRQVTENIMGLYINYEKKISHMLRTCFSQIPSGYYIQTMNSNLHLVDLLLPIGVMNVISILPLLLFAPLIECVWTCYLSMDKTPLAPAKVISEYF